MEGNNEIGKLNIYLTDMPLNKNSDKNLYKVYIYN